MSNLNERKPITINNKKKRLQPIDLLFNLFCFVKKTYTKTCNWNIQKNEHKLIICVRVEARDERKIIRLADQMGLNSPTCSKNWIFNVMCYMHMHACVCVCAWNWFHWLNIWIFDATLQVYRSKHSLISSTSFFHFISRDGFQWLFRFIILIHNIDSFLCLFIYIHLSCTILFTSFVFCFFFVCKWLKFEIPFCLTKCNRI